MKIKKMSISLLVATSVIVSGLVATAQEGDFEKNKGVMLNQSISDTNILIESEIQVRGSSAPSNNASIHNLDVSKYNYQVQKVGSRIYTDKWLTSKLGEIRVTLSDWKLISEHGGESKTVTVYLHSKERGVIRTSPRTISSNGTTSVLWTNISSSDKFYISFEVPHNGNQYSFQGGISN